jgi:hypothetical protein
VDWYGGGRAWGWTALGGLWVDGKHRGDVISDDASSNVGFEGSRNIKIPCTLSWEGSLYATSRIRRDCSHLTERKHAGSGNFDG